MNKLEKTIGVAIVASVIGTALVPIMMVTEYNVLRGDKKSIWPSKAFALYLFFTVPASIIYWTIAGHSIRKEQSGIWTGLD